MRHRPDALMISAAGLGRGMAPLTDRLPKPLISVAGRPLIDHALAISRAAGFRRIVVNSHYLGEMLESHLAGQDVNVLREPVLLETGGGLKAALNVLGPGPVATLNSDAVWAGANPLTELLAAWEPERMEALVLLSEPSRAEAHPGKGDFSRAAGGQITRPGPLIYPGAQILWPDRVAERPEPVFSMNLAWDAMIAAGGLYGTVYSGHWCDVGRPEGIATAERMLRSFGDD
jgi:MurNAc alpha-1-phosphate uridylyltransferase